MANEPITYAKPPDADKNDHLGERGEDHVSAGGPRLSEQWETNRRENFGIQLGERARAGLAVRWGSGPDVWTWMPSGAAAPKAPDQGRGGEGWLMVNVLLATQLLLGLTLTLLTPPSATQPLTQQSGQLGVRLSSPQAQLQGQAEPEPPEPPEPQPGIPRAGARATLGQQGTQQWRGGQLRSGRLEQRENAPNGRSWQGNAGLGALKYLQHSKCRTN